MQASAFRSDLFRVSPRFNIVGAISGILALLISGAQVWHDVTRAPDTSALNAGASVEMSYDPVQQQMTLLFPVLLQNNGTSDDALADMQASLNGRITWDAEHISVSESGQVAPAERIPIVLRLGSSRLDFAVVSAHQSALAVGHNRIELTLRTRQFELPLGYCFALTEDQMREMRQSAQIWTRRMTKADCAPRDGQRSSS